MTPIRLCMALLLLTMAAIAPAAAQPVKRDILALVATKEEQGVRHTRVHSLLETPLNHLGYRVVYRDVTEGLPPLAELVNYAAVLTWFENDIALDQQYFLAASVAMEAGVKWLLLGETGVSSEDHLSPAYHQFIGKLGLTDRLTYVSVTYDAAIAVQDEELIGFEAELSPMLVGFPALVKGSPDLEVHLAASSPMIGGNEPAILVATSPKGGYIASGYGVRYVESIDRSSWIVDPFRFFAKALGSTTWPVPDTTTISGRRIYFSHVDGDGWSNLSRAAGHEGDDTISAEVVRLELLEAYPDLPVTIGLIGGDVAEGAPRHADAREAARRIFALPQVEVASHTMTHPFKWIELADYDREDELAELARRRPRMPEPWAAFSRTVGSHDHGREAVGGDPVRAYAQEPFDVELEVQGSLTLAESLAPVGKQAAVYLWSGDTTPFEAVVRATREAGVANLNGGDTRFDAEFPSLAYVAPLSRPVGAERQIYAANSNENTYTNLWQGPYYGQYLLEETWDRTGSPIRLRPKNLYYHMYAGERSDSLEVLRHHLDLVQKDVIAPIEASAYARIVDGFFSAEVERIAPLTWRVKNRRALATLRLDQGEGLMLDPSASVGVIGAVREGNVIYFTLDRTAETVILALKPPSAELSDKLVFRSGRWQLFDYSATRCGATVRGQGYGTPEMLWLAPVGQYAVTATDGDGLVLWRDTVTVGSDGVLAINPAIEGWRPVTFTIDCIAATP